MRKRFLRRYVTFFVSCAALLLVAFAFRIIELPQGINVRDLLGATDTLLVYVNNPSVPEPPPPTPPDTGGGGNNGGGGNSGGSSGGAAPSGGVGAAVAPAVSATPSKPQTFKGKGDINHDNKVNLVDFSILAYWYKRPLTSQAITEGVDLNGDGKVTLADFSILAYYWNR